MHIREMGGYGRGLLHVNGLGGSWVNWALSHIWGRNRDLVRCETGRSDLALIEICADGDIFL